MNAQSEVGKQMLLLSWETIKCKALPRAPSSFLLLVLRPRAPSSVLAPSSDARKLLVVLLVHRKPSLQAL